MALSEREKLLINQFAEFLDLKEIIKDFTKKKNFWIRQKELTDGTRGLSNVQK